MSEAAAAAAPHSERKPHAHHKQFVVSRHHHGNPRVPSFGRGLNKLGGGATATTTNTTTTTTTTEKGERGERGGEKGEKSRKKTAFELGSVGSENGGGDEDFEAAEGDGGRGGGGGEAPPITRTDSSGGHGKMQRTDSRTALQRNPSTAALTKSSSTRSLDREARRHRAVGAARKGTTLHERQRSKSGDRKKTTKLTPPPPPPPPPPPLPVDVEIELPPSPPPNDSTAIISHGGGGERPPTPPLTSRFTASPSSAASAHPLRRSDSAYSIAPASRTQQKLWLQRASVASPPATPTAANHHHHSHHITLPAALEKEFDRVAREYMNVRRFKNPLLEAIERVPRRGVPGPSKPLQQEGVTLGLSRSLQEGSGRKLMRGQGESGSRDDLGVSGAVPEVEMVLERMWRREGTIVSHE